MMKNYLIALFCCVLLSGMAEAQVAIKPAIGVNFTDFSKDPANGKYKGQPGYQIGGSVAIGKKVYFEPGLF